MSHPSATSLRGPAAWSNSAVVLTSGSQQTGSYVIGEASAPYALPGFDLGFNLGLGPTTSGTPADGCSFTVVSLVTIAWGETGLGTTHNLTVSFDTSNQSGNVGIRLYVNNVLVRNEPISLLAS